MRHLLASFLVSYMIAGSVGLAQSSALTVYSADPFALLQVRNSLQSSSSPFGPAYKKLLRDAEKAMKVDIVSVTEKDALPPSGDKRDYMSLSRYWWPDPTKPDGLPYLRRDGETNPEITRYPDHEYLSTMASTVSTLALAYTLSGDQAFARRAVRWIRTWFLDSTTAMNPNLRYAQSVPGRSDGRGSGVLDGRHTALVIDAVGMLGASGQWTAADDSALRSWFGRYVTWLTESENGRDEADAENNHGTWYDAHVLPAALYAGRYDVARRIVSEAATKRILAQIEADGSQPKELVRTRSFHYSIFNLEAHARLAMQARALSVDLWSASSPEGRRLRAAVDHLLPYARGEKPWPHEDLDGVQKAPMALLLVRVYALTRESRYLDAARELSDARLASHRDLLWTGVEPETQP